MAATIAKATGYDKQRVKETHRLGSDMAEAQANTWTTFTTCRVHKDGSGVVEVRRGAERVTVEFPAESGALESVIRVNGLEVVPVRKYGGEDYGKK